MVQMDHAAGADGGQRLPLVEPGAGGGDLVEPVGPSAWRTWATSSASLRHSIGHARSSTRRRRPSAAQRRVEPPFGKADPTKALLTGLIGISVPFRRMLLPALAHGRKPFERMEIYY